MSSKYYIQSHQPQAAITSITQVEVFDVYEAGVGIAHTGSYDECVAWIIDNKD